MRLKPGVKLLGIRSELIIGLMVAEEVYDNNGASLTVTSLVDGTHGTNSLHYSGCAADLRIKDVYLGGAEELRKENINNIFEELKVELGSDFDVILHSTHIHIEYQPNP